MKGVEKIPSEDSGRGVVPGRRVRLSGESARVGAPGNRGSAAPGKPAVQLFRDGDVVTAIEVTCGCGKKVRLRCIHGAAAST